MKSVLLLNGLALAVGLFSACTQDNVHAPEPEIVIVEKEVAPEKEAFDDSLYFEGTLTTGVPAMAAVMDPVSTNDFMQFKGMTDKSSGYATLVLGSFNITIPALGNRVIAIGEMTIDSVQYAFYPNGNGMFFKDDFEVEAGSYLTQGSLQGEFSAAGGVTMTMDYKPGTMPFQCHSELEAVRK